MRVGLALGLSCLLPAAGCAPYREPPPPPAFISTVPPPPVTGTVVVQPQP